jgi:hypothetical protein
MHMVQPLTELDLYYLQRLPTEHTTPQGVPLHEVANAVHDELQYISGRAVCGIQLLERRVERVNMCGIVIADTRFAGRYYDAAGDPEKLCGCIIGDLRLGLDALRKLDPLARASRYLTQDQAPQFRTSGELPLRMLRNPVGSAVTPEGEDGDFRWGDFGTEEKGVHNGAVIVGTGEDQVMVGVSLYRGWQDIGVSAVIAELGSGLISEVREAAAAAG